MAISPRHLRLLKPYLLGRVRANGEWDIFAEGIGGRVTDLIAQKGQWITPGRAASNGGSPRTPGAPELITEGRIGGWHAALLDDETVCSYLVERGIHTKTMVDFEIGWDREKQAYTIPIRGPKGEIWNVRRYTTRTTARTKIWSVTGMRVTELYPVSQLDADRIVICEGEWDTLATIQHGYAAITRTSGAKTWYPRWNQQFKDKLVFIAQDCDKEGQNGASKIARSLGKLADVRIVQLPYPIEDKHGKDMTDFWMEHDNSDFESLLSEAMPLKKRNGREPGVVTVLDSFDAHRVGDPVKLQVTIKGKKEPGYTVPWKAKLACTQDAGPKCKICPMIAANGEAALEIP